MNQNRGAGHLRLTNVTTDIEDNEQSQKRRRRRK